MKTTTTSATALASAANIHALVKEAFDAVGASFERFCRRCHVNHRVTSLWAPTPEIMQRSSLAATVSSRRRGIGGVFGGRPDGVGR